jgi:hypothetical protein
MHGILLPPERMRCLYYLRVHHGQGFIKAQVVIAIEAPLEENAYGI